MWETGIFFVAFNFFSHYDVAAIKFRSFLAMPQMKASKEDATK